MLEAPPSFSQSQSPSSHNSFSRSNSQDSSSPPILSDGGDADTSSGSEASDIGEGVKSGEMVENVKDRNELEMDSQGVFLTQVGLTLLCWVGVHIV